MLYHFGQALLLKFEFMLLVSLKSATPILSCPAMFHSYNITSGGPTQCTQASCLGQTEMLGRKKAGQRYVRLKGLRPVSIDEKHCVELLLRELRFKYL